MQSFGRRIKKGIEPVARHAAAGTHRFDPSRVRGKEPEKFRLVHMRKRLGGVDGMQQGHQAAEDR